MKKMQFSMLMLCLPIFCFGLDGLWEMQNMLQIAIMDGQASGVMPASGDPIGHLRFDASRAKENTFIPTTITVTSPKTDMQVEMAARIMDDSARGSILIGIPSLGNLFIALYILKNDSETYMYSYALAFDLEKELYLSAEGAKNYIIFIGKMTKSGR